jgi:hypothetical protein
MLIIQLRHPQGRTSPSAHSRTRRSPRPHASMLAAPFPPRSLCPSARPTPPRRRLSPAAPRLMPYGLLRTTFPSRPILPLPPPPHCFLTAASPARCDRLHLVGEPRPPPPSRRASTMNAPASRRGGRHSCDAAPTDELVVSLPHSGLHVPPSTSASACLHSSKQSPCCKSMFQVF